MPWQYGADEGRSKPAIVFGEEQTFLRPGDIRMGKPDTSKVYHSCLNKIEHEGEPSEPKHPSNLRKRKNNSIPSVAASERGTAQTS